MSLLKDFLEVWNESIYYEKYTISWTPCRTLVLHGAWASDITRTTWLREALYEKWIPTLALDFSWHGKSSSNEVSSIRKRIDEAREVAHRYLDVDTEIQIIGFSMSGEVAIRLTEDFEVRHITLFAPGIYHHEAIDIPFWDAFSTILRTPESWKKSKIPAILAEYRGFLFLLTPEYDNVIPEGVNDIIMQSAPLAHKKRIIISDAPHMIGKWMNQNPDRIQDFLDRLQLL